ncbi:MAG: GTP-binding protein [Pseudomonadota bacterium]
MIVNEFGEAGLDDDPIEESSEVVVLMNSGCLCCSVRGDLSETVARLIQRRSVEESSFDRLLIETPAGPSFNNCMWIAFTHSTRESMTWSRSPMR